MFGAVDQSQIIHLQHTAQKLVHVAQLTPSQGILLLRMQIRIDMGQVQQLC